MIIIDTIGDLLYVAAVICLIWHMRAHMALTRKTLRDIQQCRSEIEVTQLEALIVPNPLEGNSMCRSCEHFHRRVHGAADRYREVNWFRRLVLRQKRPLSEPGSERLGAYCALRDEQLLSQYQSCDQHQPTSPQSNVARIPDGMF